MPHVDADTLTHIDTATQGVGILCCAGFLVWLFRSGEWRAPLRAQPHSQAGPTALHVAVLVGAYFALSMAAFHWVGFDEATLRSPGSDGWHRLQTADALVKMTLCIGMIIMLVASTWESGAALRPRLSVPRLALVATATAFALLPVCCAQLFAAKALWKMWQPEAAQPVHDVIEAVENTAWGTAGLVQLCIVAVGVAPLTEELFFRGVLLGALRRYTGLGWLAVMGSALAFGAVHQSQPQDVIPLVTMGIILGYVRVRSGSLGVCVGIHALFNLRTMVLVLLNPEAARGMP